MHCPSRAAGKGLLRNWVKWACGTPCILCCALACTPCTPLAYVTAACVFVCDGVLLAPLPGQRRSALAALQPSRSLPIPSSPNIPARCQAGRVRATSQTRFMTPSVLQSGRTLLMWWMEWRGKRLHNHPRGMKYGCPYLEGNQRTILGGAQPFAWRVNGWMHWCLAQARVCLSDGVLYLGHRKGQWSARWGDKND